MESVNHIIKENKIKWKGMLFGKIFLSNPSFYLSKIFWTCCTCSDTALIFLNFYFISINSYFVTIVYNIDIDL